MTSGVMWGGLLGLGLVLIYRWWAARAPVLADRLAPFVPPAARGIEPAPAPGLGPFPTVERLIGPVIADAVRVLEKWGAGRADLPRRLRRAGSPLSPAQHRAEQVVWGALGLVAGMAMSLFANVSREVPPTTLVVLVAAAGASGWALKDFALDRAAKRREARMLAELPTIAEMLALAVSAGEGVLAALERVSRIAAGDLADDIRSMVGQVRTGVPLATSLRDWASSTDLAALARFVDGLSVAIERGTPLADVLHAQAMDVRESGRRRLMEEGGKREIAMMIPVVFLILPVTVLFAVFPGIVAIRVGI